MRRTSSSAHAGGHRPRSTTGDGQRCVRERLTCAVATECGAALAAARSRWLTDAPHGDFGCDVPLGVWSTGSACDHARREGDNDHTGWLKGAAVKSMWEYDESLTDRGAGFGGVDVGATDGGIGTMDETTDRGVPCYLVVDTECWIIGTKRVDPRGNRPPGRREPSQDARVAVPGGHRVGARLPGSTRPT